MRDEGKGCAGCAEKVNTINGKFCMYLERYVERACTPPCRTGKKGKEQ